MPIADTIRCVDCGGTCHRVEQDPEFGWEPGDVVRYRCSDCLDMWYLELSIDDLSDPDDL